VNVIVMGGLKFLNAARADWKIDKKDKDASSEAKQNVGKKPHQI
jgi:hypothetical protein